MDNFIELAKKIFNENQFKYIGITEDKYKTKYYEKLGASLHQLEYKITSMVLPYVIKIENILKSITNEKKLSSAINKIVSKPADYYSNNSISWIKKIVDDNSKNLWIILSGFRVARNYIVHGENYLGLTISESHWKDTISKMMHSVSYKDLENQKDKLKKYFKAFKDNDGFYSIISYILVLIKLSQSEPISSYIFSKINYEIFIMRNSTNIGTTKILYNKLLFNDNWLQKIISNTK